MVSGFVAIALSSAAADDLTSAAEQGDPEAQFWLGVAYQFGEDPRDPSFLIPEDHDLAMAWIRKAADQGYPHAQFWLGRFWRGEQGRFAKKVLPDRGKALAWFRRAAEQGHMLAQQALSGCYLFGDGVARDMVQAYAWTNLALRSEFGFPDLLAGSLDRMEENMTPARIAEAQALSRELAERIPVLEHFQQYGGLP